MTQDGDQLQFDVRLNLESFIAGIDMTDVSDTALSAEASTYDALRAMEPAALEARFQTFWPQMAESMTITADGVAITPELIGVAVGPLGDIEVTRASEISFTAALPAGSKEVQVGWAKEFGVLVLRQMGVEAPYDGYLEAGALSDPIVLAGGGQATGWETFVSYIPVGFDHIVPKGLDHILFVLGLFFLSSKMRPLLLQISLFTLAHTITLALAALGCPRPSHAEGTLAVFRIDPLGVPESGRPVAASVAFALFFAAAESPPVIPLSLGAPVSEIVTSPSQRAGTRMSGLASANPGASSRRFGCTLTTSYRFASGSRRRALATGC